MRPTPLFFRACVIALAVGCSAEAWTGIRWQPTLDTARGVASQSNRLVLIHFHAPYCPPCNTMDQTVFARDDVAAALDRSYVCVKIDRDQLPITARQFGVRDVPADVIITPQGQVIKKLEGPSDAATYVAGMQQIAASALPSSGQGAIANSRGGILGPSGTNTLESSGPSGPLQPSREYDRLADNHQASMAPLTEQPNDYSGSNTTILGEANPPLQGGGGSGSILGASEPTIQPGSGNVSGDGLATTGIQFNFPPGSPPLALDGYDAVLLAEEGRWVLGNDQFGVRHGLEERTYLFSGAEQRDRFLRSPERYAPVLSGNDVVLAVRNSQQVDGRREHGAWFEERVYLFASEETLHEFMEGGNPHIYRDHGKRILAEMARRAGVSTTR